MANLRSLIVKIGADVTDIQKAFTSVETRGKTVQEALKNLGNTPLGTKTVEDLNRLTANLNLVTAGYQKVADNALKTAQGIAAIGGPARLTATDLNTLSRSVEKGLDAFRALGQEAPEELRKVGAALKEQKAALALLNAPAGAASGGGLLGLFSLMNVSAAGVGIALVGLGKQALTFADTLTKLSDKTGIGVEALQKLDAIAGPSGNSLEEIANGVNKLQKNLVGGSQETSHALDRIGLSIGQLRSLAPEEQFIAIAKGIQGIKDPAEQTATAIALFGKAGAELLPTIKADIDKLKDSTVIASKESIKAIDDFADALDTLKKSSINIAGEILGAFLRTAKGIQDSLPKAPPRTADTSALAQGPAAFSEAIANDQAERGRLIGSIPRLPSQGVIGGPDVDQALARLNAGLAEETRHATEAAESLARVQKIQEQLFSTTVIRNADEYVRALGDIKNIAHLTETEQNKLRQTMVDAVAAYEAAGRTAPPALRKIIVEIDSLAHAQKAMDTAAKGSNGALIGFNFTLTQLSNLAKGFTADGLIPMAKGFSDLERAELGARLESERLAAQQKRTREALAVQLATPFGLPNVQSSLDRLLPDPTIPAQKWKSELSEISTALGHLAQVSDGAFGEMVRDIANVIVALDVVEQGLNQFINAKTTTGRAVGLASAGAGFIQATSSKSALAASLGGALSGASIGASIGTAIFPGVGTAIGAGIGAAAGFLVGLFRALHKSEADRLAFDVGRDFGVSISEGLSKELEHLEETHHIGRFAASILDLDKIIAEGGGLNSGNLNANLAKLHDTFSLIATGQISVADGADVLNKNFGNFVNAAVDKLGLIPPALLEIIRLNDLVGTSAKAISDFKIAQATDNILGGVGTFLGVGNTAATTRQTAVTHLADLQSQLGATGDPKQQEALRKEIAKTTQEIQKQDAILKVTQVSSQQAASALSFSVLGAFATLVANGTSITDAVKAVKPAVEGLQDQLTRTGFEGGAAFAYLRDIVGLASDAIAGPALDSVGGLGQVLAGLSNTGLLTQDAFNGIGDQVAATFDGLVAQGKDGNQVLRLMQPTLQRIFELQEKFGFATDEATQKLLDQAIAQGIVGDAFKSPQQQMIDGLNHIGEILDRIAIALGAGLPEAATKAKDGVNAELNKIKDPVVRIHFKQDGNPDDSAQVSTGGLVVPGGVQHFAFGGRVLPFLARGTDTVPAMLTPGEIVLNKAQQQRLASGLASSGDGGDVNIILQMDGQVVSRTVIRRWQLNKGGEYTAARGALGMVS